MGNESADWLGNGSARVGVSGKWNTLAMGEVMNRYTEPNTLSGQEQDFSVLPQAMSQGGASVGSLGKIRVLLADDHEIVREGLASLLESQSDIEVIGQVGDGETAVNAARQTLPDVVVMDVSMPGMNGVEATRLLRAELPSVQVIALSMHEEMQISEAMQQAGAATYVSKGGATELLIDAIRLCAGRNVTPSDQSSSPARSDKA